MNSIMQQKSGRSAKKKGRGAFSEVHNFVQSYDQVDNSQSQHSSFEKRIAYDLAQPGELREEIVIVPDTLPGNQHQENADFQRVDDIKDA